MEPRAVTFKTPDPPDVALERIRAALIQPNEAERLLPSKIYLGDSAQAPDVSLFRNRGGRRYYLEFKGTIAEEGRGSVLQGEFVPIQSSVTSMFTFLSLGFCFVTMFVPSGELFALRPLAAVLFTVAVIGLTAAVYRFHSANVQAESELLEEAISSALNDLPVDRTTTSTPGVDGHLARRSS